MNTPSDFTRFCNKAINDFSDLRYEFVYGKDIESCIKTAEEILEILDNDLKTMKTT